MAFVTGRCPNCSGEVQLDESKDKGFCLHCGSQIQVQEAVKLKVELAGKVSVDGLNTIMQLKANAERSFSVKQYQNASSDWIKAVELDKTDHESYWGQVRCWMALSPTIVTSEGITPYGYVRVEDLVASALAYAPPEKRREYEAAIRKHDANVDVVKQQQADEARRKQEEERRHYREVERFERPRNVGCGIVCLLMALGCIGGVVTFIVTEGGGPYLMLMLAIQAVFVVLTVVFFKKPKK